MEIKELSIKEKIGQMVIIGMDTNYITDRIKNMIQNYKIGGVILYRKNFSTYQDMLKLIKELKSLNKENKVPLFIAIDQEGGRVNRMPKEIKNLPAAKLVAKYGGEKLVAKAADITGKLLQDSGYNLNFAPVLDIDRTESQGAAIGDRSFSKDKELVAECGIAAMKALQKNNILPVVKHFPGHGATKQDSHYFLPVINIPMKKIENEDMYPFEQAIKNGADAVLVGHLLIMGVTGMYPASLSRKFITKYLRAKYRYNGLVVTDDLKMRAIKFFYGPDTAVRKAFEAGNDIIVFRFNKDEEQRVLDKIESLVKTGKIKENRINKSVNRILKIKEKYNISDSQDFEEIDVEEINKEISKIRTKCKI